MVLGRFREAVSDVAETIRRAFVDPPCHSVAVTYATPGTFGAPGFEVQAKTLDYGFTPMIACPAVSFAGEIRETPVRVEAVIRAEDAWAAWAQGAQVIEMPRFETAGGRQMTVPPLPRGGRVRRTDLPPFQVSARAYRQPFTSPRARTALPGFGPVKTLRDLESMIRLPIAIAGEDFQKLPKALNMRFTFQLVKATGENIRNLEILGVYPVPVKGVAGLRHDPRTGRILVNLNQEAIGARRGRFILARRRDDRSYVSCFAEEG